MAAPRPIVAVSALAILTLAGVLSAPSARAVCLPGDVFLDVPTMVATGNSPFGIAARDFNGDGLTDIVVAAWPGSGPAVGALYFYRGLGVGFMGSAGFSDPVLSPAPYQVFDLVAGDFTGDGKLDVVTTIQASDRVLLFPGLGDGTFGSPNSFNTPGSPHHLTAADLNADGALDLVVAINNSYAVAVLLGHLTNGLADGTFLPAVPYGIGNYGTGVAVGDVDGDGALDIAATEYTSHTIALLMGQKTGGAPNGQFVAGLHVVGGSIPYDVALYDVDLDGKLDLVVSNSGTDGAQWVRNGGAGLWGGLRPIRTGGGIGQAEAGDFDGDGFTDFVLTSPTSNSVALVTGDATQNFSLRSSRMAPSSPFRIAKGEFNSDGLLDCAVTGRNSSSFGVYLSKCTDVGLVFKFREIRDVPNDQGGKVWLSWNRHPRDVSTGAITGYRVWRRVPSPSASGVTRVTRAGAALAYWEAAASLPAQRMASYAYTAATPQDSLPGSNPYTAFFITATTAMADSFFDSAVDSGYSVDNLSPAPPPQATATLAPGGTSLAWTNVNEPDLYGVRVYRGGDAFFPADDVHLLGTFTDSHWVDGEGEAGHVYKLASVDVHGNRGPLALLRPDGAVAAIASLVSAEARPDRVSLVWYTDVSAIPSATLERSGDGVAWSAVASDTADGNGRLTFEDTGVLPGRTYRYRLAWDTPQGLAVSGVEIVTVPGVALALSAPNPVRGADLTFAVTLPGDGEAALDVFDIGGRRVLHRGLSGLAAGAHKVEAGSARLRPGVYLARLTSGAQVAKRRVVLIE